MQRGHYGVYITCIVDVNLYCTAVREAQVITVRNTAIGNLALGSSSGELPLEHHHPERYQEHDQSVARVAEHHSKQERKRNDRVRRCT